MQQIQRIEIRPGSREEILPGYSEDFPYTGSYADLNLYASMGVPWHWHRAVELFYVESGSVEYTTPRGKWVFPAGSGGFVGANVLHATAIGSTAVRNVQLLHLFDPVLLAGSHGSRMETKYILPLTSAPELELLPLYPEDPVQADILSDLKRSFTLSDREWGYELRLREALTGIWLKLCSAARPAMEDTDSCGRSDALVKAMMVYVFDHYRQPITVEELAASVHISRRVCFRVFRDNLHIAPQEYIREYRLGKACRLLADSDTPITQVGSLCGLGSSSYFGKTFRERFGCTPTEYRKKWHDRDNNPRVPDSVPTK